MFEEGMSVSSEDGTTPESKSAIANKSITATSRALDRLSNAALGVKQWVRKQKAPGNQVCSIIGPSAVGKTFLLAAIHQACLLSGDDGFLLTFIPDIDPKATYDPKKQDLLQEAIDRIIHHRRESLKATEKPAIYSFDVFCQSSRFGSHILSGKEQMLHFQFLDGPGEVLFPQGEESRIKTPNFDSDRDRLSQHLYKTDCLIICIDSTDPRLPLFHREFPIIASQARHVPTGRLKATKVLVLLTKIDAVSDAFLSSARDRYRIWHMKDVTSPCEDPEEPTAAMERLNLNRLATPARLAQVIDPIEQGRAFLSQATISLIRRHIDNNANMAIGVCSSTGFQEDGMPLWDFHAGMAQTFAEHESTDAYRSWVPFGIKESILFLMSGKIISPLRSYAVKRDMMSSKRMSFKIALWRKRQQTLL
jgi:hypothetical protein